ncbi:Ribosome biogenesis protein Nop16 [Gnomoniopsis smithogilvyi]|uniref:Nucleolar protein 16 n=1 Tax=Gnomoniopsis smithogilvyi TaxID=1191159 RepID=A0A9W9CUJ2_9PEZI|nr:Ribosome biogenesis protein Nop16 [Gnomoniopsis smithogilvyi]
MGRDLQKRKNRSSRPTIRQSNRLKKPLNPQGNSLVARNWNKKETLSQNYRRLGLTAKLGKATGGMEAHPSAPASQDPLAVSQAAGTRSAIRSVKVERDAEGKIVKVLRRENPLNDPLNEISDDENDDEAERTEEEEQREVKVVDLLEQQASVPTESHKRHQSAREREWLERLIAKHGDDVAAMSRDLKLNPMQQTVGEIKKKLKVYRQELGN